jgi:hypothetical protein
MGGSVAAPSRARNQRMKDCATKRWRAGCTRATVDRERRRGRSVFADVERRMALSHLAYDGFRHLISWSAVISLESASGIARNRRALAARDPRHQRILASLEDSARASVREARPAPPIR